MNGHSIGNLGRMYWGGIHIKLFRILNSIISLGQFFLFCHERAYLATVQ